MFNSSSTGELKERATAAFASEQNRLKTRTEPESTVVGWRRLMLLFLAAVFFGLGLLGVLLPGVPATPFLLLTSYFLVRSSPRLNAWLLRTRVFGPILVDWQVHGGVRMHVRCKAIAVVGIAVAISIYIAGYALSVTLAMVLLATIGIVVILKLPAAKAP